MTPADEDPVARLREMLVCHCGVPPSGHGTHHPFIARNEPCHPSTCSATCPYAKRQVDHAHVPGEEGALHEIARYRIALETITRLDRFARHGAAHAQVSRAVRIALAALNGEDPE